jgi:hypothetical protein
VAALAVVAARPDQQNAWVIAGDDRGSYGEHLPQAGWITPAEG